MGYCATSVNGEYKNILYYTRDIYNYFVFYHYQEHNGNVTGVFSVVMN